MPLMSGGVGQQAAPPGQLFPTVESVTGHTPPTGTTHNCVLTATIESGDLLLAFVSNDGGDAVTTPSGWTQLYSLPQLGEGRFGAYVRVADGAEGGTTVNFITSGSEDLAAQIFRISTWDGSLANIAYTGGMDLVEAPPITTGWGTFATLFINVLQSSSTSDYGSCPPGYSDVVLTSTGDLSTDAEVWSCRIFNNSEYEDPGSWVLIISAVRFSCSLVAIKGFTVV